MSTVLELNRMSFICMYLYGHGYLSRCMFPYVSTRVLVCTVATIVMSQLIYPPNLLLLQEVMGPGH